MISEISTPPEDVSVITLTQGYHAEVDTDNLRFLSSHRWYASGRGGLLYARRKEKGKTVYMHREIMNAPDGIQIDHINGNGLDNRRLNLRVCTTAQNQHNSTKRANTSSRFKGVDRDRKKWRARICINGEKIWIGRYKSEFEAAEAYDKKAVEHFGEFANLNFPSQQSKLISEKKHNENARLSEYGNAP